MPALAGGGIWKTVDGGTSWVPLTDSQTTLSTGAIAIAPSNANVIYAGTGEADNSPLAFYGRGVLKSTDAGATWTLQGTAPSTEDHLADGRRSHQRHVGLCRRHRGRTKHHNRRHRHLEEH